MTLAANGRKDFLKKLSVGGKASRSNVRIRGQFEKRERL
jgi:hypothetical protein